MAPMGTFEGADPIPPARPAATVVVARPAAPGVEVLVLRRSAGSRFVPGFVVFPGGSIDGGDRALADAWFGSEDEAPRACAVRELTEEAGLALTARGLVERGTGAVGSEPPSIRQLPEIGRWIAPEFLPVRFDARFFAALGSDVEPRPDGVEVDLAWWARPDDVLGAQRSGEMPLAWPTLKTLEALAGCRSVEEVLALRVEQVAPPGAPSAPGLGAMP